MPVPSIVEIDDPLTDRMCRYCEMNHAAHLRDELPGMAPRRRRARVWYDRTEVGRWKDRMPLCRPHLRQIVAGGAVTPIPVPPATARKEADR